MAVCSDFRFPEASHGDQDARHGLIFKNPIEQTGGDGRVVGAAPASRGDSSTTLATPTATKRLCNCTVESIAARLKLKLNVDRYRKMKSADIPMDQPRNNAPYLWAAEYQLYRAYFCFVLSDTPGVSTENRPRDSVGRGSRLAQHKE